jgi:hypothetical protein
MRIFLNMVFTITTPNFKGTRGVYFYKNRIYVEMIFSSYIFICNIYNSSQAGNKILTIVSLEHHVFTTRGISYSSEISGDSSYPYSTRACTSSASDDHYDIDAKACIQPTYLTCYKWTSQRVILW